MVKQKYKERRRQRKRPWWEVAQEEAARRGRPQQWEQTAKKVEADLLSEQMEKDDRA